MDYINYVKIQRYKEGETNEPLQYQKNFNGKRNILAKNTIQEKIFNQELIESIAKEKQVSNMTAKIN